MRRLIGSLVVVVLVGCGGDQGAQRDAAFPDAAVLLLDGDLPSVDAPVGVPVLAIAPASHDFGVVLVGMHSPNVSFTVLNTGTGATGQLSASFVGSPDFTTVTNGCIGRLAAGTSCVIVVQLTPAAVGVRSATLTVAASPGGSVQASLTGTGCACGPMTITPVLQDFGTVGVGQQGAPATFTVTNQSGVPTGTLTAATFGAQAADFTIVTNNCSAPLAPAASCTLTVRFNPLTAGIKSSTLMVTGTPGGTAIATLNGIGGGLALAPGTFGFGGVCAGSSGGDTVFTATNFGAATTGAVTIATAGPDPTQFAVASGGTCVSGTTTLAASASCTIKVHFSPTSAGAKTASLSVTPAGGSATSAALSGTGLACDPGLTISPNLQDFGATTLNTTSSSVVFTVTNSGGAASGALSVSFSGTNASEFSAVSDTCSGSPLAAGTSCTVTVHFTPTIPPGSKSAALDVSIAGVVRATASLQGSGVEGPHLSLSPSTVMFSNTAVGATSAATTLTMTNTGTASTGSLTTTLGGSAPSQFAIVPGSDHCAGTVLAGGTSCTVDVTFKPTASGSQAATLAISGTPGGTATAVLSGTAP